jgi:predicted ATP-grasp superfamily ATP-dependent carboligase
MRIDNTTPAVVLMSCRHGGLGIVRSLGRMGVPIYVVDPSSRNPAAHSRYMREIVAWDVEQSPAARSVDFLLRLGRRLGRRAILIPTTDTSSLFVDEHADPLREWFIFPKRPADLTRTLCNKKQMDLLARRCGVPTAETAFPECRADVLDYLQRARFPVILKPIYRWKLLQSAGAAMFITHNRRELLERFDALEDPRQPNLMLQEYIPGEADTTWMFNGYFDSAGTCLFGWTGRKLRQCPVHTGATSLGICAANEFVQHTTTDFMQAIGYRGILDIDYRYDARDRRYKVLDVNPRIGATFRLFTAENGLDVARVLYLDLTGQPVEKAPVREGRKWIVEDCDLIACLRYCREGKLRPLQWLKSLRDIRETALWAGDDPLPLLGAFLIDGRELTTRMLHTLRLNSGRWRYAVV